MFVLNLGVSYLELAAVGFLSALCFATVVCFGATGFWGLRFIA